MGTNTSQLPVSPAPITESPQNRSRFSPSHLSIRHRLPILIGTLLLGVIVASTWASYRGVKDSAYAIAHQRLRFLTSQVVTLFQQSLSNMSSKTQGAANDASVREYLRSPESVPRDKLMAALQQFIVAEDPNRLHLQLWKADQVVFSLPETTEPLRNDLSAEFARTASEPTAVIGSLRAHDEFIVFPIVAAVKDDAGQRLGYLVRWRKLAANADARKQLMDLIGTKAEIYVGNTSGDVWSDMLNLSKLPPPEVRSAADVTQYTREEDISVEALAKVVPGTPWTVMIEFPNREISAQADLFLQRMLVVGIVLMSLGVAAAFALSRSITQPLRSLAEATSAISSGDYSQLVHVASHDELGELASAFNTMVTQVRDSQSRLEEKVQERTAQLEAANRELEAFSYSVSHDLRAPLRAVDGFSRILREDYGEKFDAEGRRLIDVIRTSAQNMGKLIDDLLAFSRLARQHIARSPIDMTGLARDVFVQLEKIHESESASFTVKPLAEAKGDRPMIRQVLVNLMSNSIKYSKPGQSARIEVGCTEGAEVNTYYVRDDGVGFDLRYADKLFGVFQRLHSPADFEGTGVGLAIVKRIVERHGGRVWADARPNEGATFFFTLPVTDGRENGEFQ